MFIGYALFIMSHRIYPPSDYIPRGVINDANLPLGYQFIYSHVGAYGSETFYGDYPINPALLLIIPFALHLFWQVWKLDSTNEKLCLSVFKSNRTAALLLPSWAEFTEPREFVITCEITCAGFVLGFLLN